jgi:hypothetical protein
VAAVEDAAAEVVEAVMVREERVVAGAVEVALTAELVDAVDPAEPVDEPPHPATSRTAGSAANSVEPRRIRLMIPSIDAD